MSDASRRPQATPPKPPIIGLWLTVVVAFLVTAGSMSMWIDQYGNVPGVLLGLATGGVVLLIGAGIGWAAGRAARNSGR